MPSPQSSSSEPKVSVPQPPRDSAERRAFLIRLATLREGPSPYQKGDIPSYALTLAPRARPQKGV